MAVQPAQLERPATRGQLVCCSMFDGVMVGKLLGIFVVLLLCFAVTFWHYHFAVGVGVIRVLHALPAQTPED